MRGPHIVTLREAGGDLRLSRATRTRALELLETVRAAGLRCGWLEFREDLEVPEDLYAAATHGAVRAVRVAAGGTVSFKPRRGAPVVRDLVRESFQGCALVLVEGRQQTWSLEPSAESAVTWHLSGEGGSEELDHAAFVARLRRPRLLPSVTPSASNSKDH